MSPRKPTAGSRLIGYVRVSTDEQAQKGLSLLAQRERLAAHAVAHGYELIAVEEDAGLSGKLAPERCPDAVPGLFLRSS